MKTDGVCADGGDEPVPSGKKKGSYCSLLV